MISGFNNRPVRVGELLIHAGLVASTDVTEAEQVSKRLQIPLGRVLIVSGCIDEKVLEAALQAQKLVHDDSVTLETASHAIRSVACEGLPFVSALQQAQPEREGAAGNELKDLLTGAGMLTSEQWEVARQAAETAGIPLRSAIVLQSALSASVISTAEELSMKVARGDLQPREAIDQLKQTELLWSRAEESLKRFDLEDRLDPSVDALFEEGRGQSSQVRQQYRLIDLLNESGVMTSRDLQEAYVARLDDPAQSAELFLNLGLLDRETAKAARRCHSLVKKGLLTTEQAARIVRKCRGGKQSLDDALTENTTRAMPFFDPEWRRNALQTAMITAVVSGLGYAWTRRKRGSSD